MFESVRNWLALRRQREFAIRRALQHFQQSRCLHPMGGHVLRVSASEAIVRVMFVTNRVPPDRAWFAVSLVGDTIRELSFDDVEAFELPWR